MSFVRHRCHSVVLRISRMDGKDPAARARISRARVFELRRAVRRSPSRTARAFCRSREVLQTTRANVCPNFASERRKAAGVREVDVDLTIPGSVVTLPDKGSELRQFSAESASTAVFISARLTAAVYPERCENATSRRCLEAPQKSRRGGSFCSRTRATASSRALIGTVLQGHRPKRRPPEQLRFRLHGGNVAE